MLDWGRRNSLWKTHEERLCACITPQRIVFQWNFLRFSQTICCSYLQNQTSESLLPLSQLLARSRTMSSFQKGHLPPERTCQIIPHYLILFRSADIFHSGNVGKKIALNTASINTITFPQKQIDLFFFFVIQITIKRTHIIAAHKPPSQNNSNIFAILFDSREKYNPTILHTTTTITGTSISCFA